MYIYLRLISFQSHFHLTDCRNVARSPKTGIRCSHPNRPKALRLPLAIATPPGQTKPGRASKVTRHQLLGTIQPSGRGGGGLRTPGATQDQTESGGGDVP